MERRKRSLSMLTGEEGWMEGRRKETEGREIEKKGCVQGRSK